MAATSIAASGIVLEPLTKDNYENWSTLVRNYLMGQDLWDVVALAPETSVPESADRKMKNAKALHIIQLACGSETLVHIREVQTAKEAWSKLSALHSTYLEVDPDIQQGMLDDSLLHCKPLLRSDAELFIENDSTAIFSTSSSGRTILHLAVIAGHGNIVEELVKLGKDKLVKMQDNNGCTVLALAAELTGNINIAKSMVEMRGSDIEFSQDLLSMETKCGDTPVLLAAAKGHKQMTRYLYSRTRLEELVNENSRNAVLLLTRCITARIFDVALSLLQGIPQLPLAHEAHNLQPLHALARMPSAFPSGSRLGLRQKFIYDKLRLETTVQEYERITVIVSNVAQEEGQHKFAFGGRLLQFVRMSVQNSILSKHSGIREIYDQKMTHHLVLEILSCLCEKVKEFDESQLKQVSAYGAMLQAAKLGVVEFIDEMSKANHNLLWAVDIFSHAIINRRRAVFQLMINGGKVVIGQKEFIKGRTDAFGNTLLHLVAYFRPSSYLDHGTSPVVHMHTEIQWFKAVERIVHPMCKEARNAEGKKPGDIFSESHRQLMKDGEKWVKESAGQFIAVGGIIITITFAAALTVPGGDKTNGNVDMRVIFIVSDAMSLFTSSISVFIFIGVLTSRYALQDFNKSLAYRFIFGHLFLLYSAVSMIVAFCAAVDMIFLKGGHQRGEMVAVAIGAIPFITSLVPSQLRRLVDTFISLNGSI